MKQFLIAAAFGLVLGVGAVDQASAASFTGLDTQVSKATGGSTLTKANGWWAVPAVVGGVILLDHVHRHHHHHYYHRHHHHRHYR